MANKTSFTQHNKTELLKIADEFAVVVNPNSTKDEIVARLAEDGVEYSLYQSMHPELFPDDGTLPALVTTTAVTVEPVVATEDNKMLVKMTRKNASFEARGARFSRGNPFALVSEEDAEYLINELGGFQLAMPREAADFYK